MKSLLARLVDWYISNCNEEWEHSHGFSIVSLDNPGVSILIDIKGTKLENCEFHQVKKNYESDVEWFICEININGCFEGNGSPEQLDAMLEIFLNWASMNDATC